METKRIGQSIKEEFPAHDYTGWKKAAEDLLKGRPFEKVLITPTYEGFDLDPIYMAETSRPEWFGASDVPGFGTKVRGSNAGGYVGAGWKASQELVAPEVKQLNAMALKALMKGQTEINLWFDGPTRLGEGANAGNSGQVGRCGVSVSSLGEMELLLKDIEPTAISWYLHSGPASLALVGIFYAALKARNVDLDAVEVHLDFDPLGHAVVTGDWQTDNSLGLLVREMKHHFKQGTALNPSGIPYHNSGASSSQELAFVLATGVEYLREGKMEGLGLDDVAKSIKFTLGVGPYTFIEIAKFRAFRKLWNRVLEEVGVVEIPIQVHARTGLFNKTKIDPYVNLLRTTTEAFSAVVGGCDSLHVGAFDEVIREPNDFSRRLALNIQLILNEECDLGKVIDPAGGSWAVETLTHKIAEQAWSMFQKVEELGGMKAALIKGYPQEIVKGTREMRLANLQKRKDILVGTNQYPNRHEKPLPNDTYDYDSSVVEILAQLESVGSGKITNNQLESIKSNDGCLMAKMATAYQSGARINQVAEYLAPLKLESKPEMQRLEQTRLGSLYEALRAKSEDLKKAGKSVALFQLNYGPSRNYRLRADWTSAFFEVAGMEPINEDDYDTVEAGIKELKSSNCKVAILVSDDKTYENSVVEIAKGVKAACPEVFLILAGAPGEREAEWRTAGVDEFVNVRSNHYQFLKQIFAKLEA